jgi:uridine kinase
MVHSTVKIIESKIKLLLQEKRSILIAIDGRCAAGKTTLAARLQEQCECNVIHMDHFFLRPEQRTAERMNTPGGNVDHERFLKEVLLPLSRREPFSYRAYDCKIQELTEAIQIDLKPVNIIEGSYSCHPSLYKYYDLTVFLTIDEEEQMCRIQCRNGPKAATQFREKWIPLEEDYFSAYPIAEYCDLQFQADK